MKSDFISKLAANGNKSILLYGVAGTEKTNIAVRAAGKILNIDLKNLMRYRYDPVGICSDSGCWEIMSMHPGCDYSNFIGTRREKSTSVTGNNNFQRGAFSLICKKATEMRDIHTRNDSSKSFVLILDNIEKVNLPDMFGELMAALKVRDVIIPTTLTRTISVPDNLFIIATANVISPRYLSKYSEIARYFTPVNIQYDINRLPKLLSQYNLSEKDIASFTAKCDTLNSSLSKIIYDSIHVDNVGIGQEYLAKIKDYMTPPDWKKSVTNSIDTNMLKALWDDIIDPLLYEILGSTAYTRSIAKLDAAKTHFLKP